MSDAEVIDNIDLFERNLKHIEFELLLENPSYFRIAVESHNAFLRAMVQALKGCNNFFIDKKLGKEKNFVCTINNTSPIMIKKEKIDNCKNAWKFSDPIAVSVNENNNDNISRGNDKYKKFLAGFYDLLAMIQCDYFMKYYSSAETINITNENISTLEWLHENVRNEYEHFIPKSYRATKNDLIYSSILCLDICKQLLVDTSNIYLLELRHKFKCKLENIIFKLNNDFK